jgi:hypothetical protein
MDDTATQPIKKIRHYIKNLTDAEFLFILKDNALCRKEIGDDGAYKWMIEAAIRLEEKMTEIDGILRIKNKL